MTKENVRTMLHICREEFLRWMRSSRLIILAVMLVFVHIQIITTLRNTAYLMEDPVSFPEGFVALGNSGVIVLVIPALWMVLMSDFPQKGGIDFLYQIRCSKRVWICGQTLFAFTASLFVVAFLFISSMIMLIGSARWTWEFSYAVTHYISVFPERSGDYILQLLPENLYQQMTLGTAAAHTICMMMLYFLFLALILLLASLCSHKNAGLLIDTALILLGTVTTAARIKLMWIFPMAHSISWVHYEKYMREEIFPMAGSYIYMIAGCVGLFLCCMIAAKKYQAGRE